VAEVVSGSSSVNLARDRDLRRVAGATQLYAL